MIANNVTIFPRLYDRHNHGNEVTGLRVMSQPVTLIKHVKITRKSVWTEQH